MEDELRCPSCKKLYVEPVLLPCWHSLCLACAVNLQAQPSSVGPAEGSASSTTSSSHESTSNGNGNGSVVGTDSHNGHNGHNGSLNCDPEADKVSILSETDSGVVCSTSSAASTGSSRPGSYVGTPGNGGGFPPSGGTLCLSCPVCQKTVFFDDGGANNLPKYKAMQRIVDKYLESKNVKLLCQMCEKEPREATVACEQCELDARLPTGTVLRGLPRVVPPHARAPGGAPPGPGSGYLVDGAPALGLAPRQRPAPRLGLRGALGRAAEPLLRPVQSRRLRIVSAGSSHDSSARRVAAHRRLQSTKAHSISAINPAAAIYTSTFAYARADDTRLFTARIIHVRSKIEDDKGQDKLNRMKSNCERLRIGDAYICEGDRRMIRFLRLYAMIYPRYDLCHLYSIFFFSNVNRFRTTSTFFGKFFAPLQKSRVIDSAVYKLETRAKQARSFHANDATSIQCTESFGTRRAESQVTPSSADRRRFSASLGSAPLLGRDSSSGSPLPPLLPPSRAVRAAPFEKSFETYKSFNANRLGVGSIPTRRIFEVRFFAWCGRACARGGAGTTQKEDPGYVISLRSGKKTPITVRAGSDRITISRSPRRGLTKLAIDGAQHSHDEVRSENHTHKRAPDAGAKAQLERMMAPEARTTLTHKMTTEKSINNSRRLTGKKTFPSIGEYPLGEGNTQIIVRQKVSGDTRVIMPVATPKVRDFDALDLCNVPRLRRAPSPGPAESERESGQSKTHHGRTRQLLTVRVVAEATASIFHEQTEPSHVKTTHSSSLSETRSSKRWLAHQP
ncbi:unnamed protein product [Trichogramma brassicae]|uniref:RING-type domain-containing protein n=1 Tax=Trichogramma brassicae TaxID=86971 RepID=A0A6H5J315_9HYME|nr:unnamed protein product [Trichogramma brassicae]